MWGQTSNYLVLFSHVNVSWCRSHTDASGAIATSRIVQVTSQTTELKFSLNYAISFLRKSTSMDPLAKSEDPFMKSAQNKAISINVLISYSPYARIRHDRVLPRCRSNIGIGNVIVGSFLLVLNSMALYAIWNMLCNLI